MTRRQKAIAFFVALCVLLVAAAISLNVGWVVITAERAPLRVLIFGIITFGLIIAGFIIYTVFLVLEIRRNEDHDTFINSVTHELKTPIASIRLYLETLQSRTLTDEQRHGFYDVMLADAERLHRTVDQVLKAGAASQKPKVIARAPVDMGALTRECVVGGADEAPCRSALRCLCGGMVAPFAGAADTEACVDSWLTPRGAITFTDVCTDERQSFSMTLAEALTGFAQAYQSKVDASEGCNMITALY